MGEESFSISQFEAAVNRAFDKLDERMQQMERRQDVSHQQMRGDIAEVRSETNEIKQRLAAMDVRLAGNAGANRVLRDQIAIVKEESAREFDIIKSRLADHDQTRSQMKGRDGVLIALFGATFVSLVAQFFEPVTRLFSS